MDDGFDLPIPTEACMVLILGETGAGKSYFIRKLTSNPDVKVGHSLESYQGEEVVSDRAVVQTTLYLTGAGRKIGLAPEIGCAHLSGHVLRRQSLAAGLQKCKRRGLRLEGMPFEVNIGGTNLLLIDTPGFDDSVRSDGDVILEIATSLSFQAALGIRLLGLIYLHDITVPRMRGSLRRELEMLKLIAGPQNYRNILLVTTKWGDKSRRREYENRQFQLEENYWEDMMVGGAACHRFEGSADSAKAIVSQLNFRADVVLALQRELSGDTEFSQTSVGRYAEQSRSKIQAELDAMSSMSRVTSSQSQSSKSTPSQTAVELEQTLQSSALDSQKMGVRLDDQVKEWIREAVREEKEQSRQRPSAAKAMTAVLAKTSSFFRSFRTGPYQGAT